MSQSRTYPLFQVLHLARDARLPDGWVYHTSPYPLTGQSLCLLLTYDDLDFEGNIPPLATEMGFAHEGLDAPTIEGITQSCAQFADPPTDDLMVEAYNYYLRWDAYLPGPGAPDPPPPEVIRHSLDLAFYEGLGPERPDVRCRNSDCDRGAITLSALCRKHHFENVMRRPCPFDDRRE